MPSDGIELGLMVCDTKDESSDHEVVALFCPKLHNSSKLTIPTAGFGTPEEKYAKLEVKIFVEIAFEGVTRREIREPIELTATLYCCLGESLTSRIWRPFEKFASEKWRCAPQWIRSYARGAVILAEDVIKVNAQVVPGVDEPIFCWHLWNAIKIFFTLPCFVRAT